MARWESSRSQATEEGMCTSGFRAHLALWFAVRVASGLFPDKSGDVMVRYRGRSQPAPAPNELDTRPTNPCPHQCFGRQGPVFQ
jgi:hypothetical protein